MIENYDQMLSQIISTSLQKGNKWCNRLLSVKALRACNFIENALHHGRSPCNFPNFYEFLEKFL